MFSTLVLFVLSAAPSAACPPGQSIGPDTVGNCCWPQQAWSASRGRCVGVPVCVAPLTAQGETCAMACPVGQTLGSDTAGHCCWPRQVWAPSQSRCVGVPECPPGLTAQAETCVDRSSEPPPPPLTPAPAPPPVAGPTASAPAPPAAAPAAALPAPVKTHTERHARKGLVITGAALLGVGYIIAVLGSLGAAAYVAEYPGNNCLRHVSNTAWIPLAGPAIAVLGQAGLTREGGRPCPAETVYLPGVALAVIDTALQVTGLALLVVGLTARQSVEVPDEPQPTSSSGFSFEPYVSLGAPGASLGLTAGARW